MDLGTTTLRRLRAVFGSSKLHPLCSSQGPLNPDPVLIPIQVAPFEPERLSRPESRDQQKAPQCRDDLLRSVSLPSHPDLLAEKLQTRSILTLHLVSFQGVRSRPGGTSAALTPIVTPLVRIPAILARVSGYFNTLESDLGQRQVRQIVQSWLNLDDFLRAPWKGALSLRVRIPPGSCRSSR